MIKHNQDGAVGSVAVSLILTVILLLAAIGFGAWAFSSRQDYKNHTDAKVDVAVKAAVAKESVVKDQQFAQEVKQPLTTYNGPEALGSIVLQYPKTWSGYINSSGSGDSSNSSLDLYFNPGFVPTVGGQGTVFALHVQVLSQPYSQTVQSFQGQQQGGNVTVSAYSLPKLPQVVGIEVTGTLPDEDVGTIVILPVRSQTIELETDSTQYLSDFNNYVLANFSFSP